MAYLNGSFADFALKNSQNLLHSELKVQMATVKSSSFASLDETLCFCIGSVYDPVPEHNPVSSSAAYCLDKFTKSGLDGLKNLDGSFLLMIIQGSSVHFLRDRFGSGPQLYYSASQFSNNLTDLIHLHKETQEPNWESIAGFLHFGYIPSPSTAIKNFWKLSAGTLLTWKGGEISQLAFFSMTDLLMATPVTPSSLDDAVAQYRFLHETAIRRRIAGKARIGLLLSGGYDSAGNLAALRRVYSGDVEAVTVGFKNNPWSEIPLARQMAADKGALLHEYEIDGSEILRIPEMISALGDPFQEGGLMVNFAALDLAAGLGFDVVLGGDGNDQHFGTAGRELAMYYYLRRFGVVGIQRLAHRLLEKRADHNDNKLFRAYFHNRKIHRILLNDEFGYSSPEVKSMTGLNIPIEWYGAYRHKKSTRDFDSLFELHHVFVDIDQIIREVILFKAGQVSYFNGVPMAFPYMDSEVSEFIVNLPRAFRFNGTPIEIAKGRGSSKFIHKKAYKEALPQAIAGRKKQGGFAPLPEFYKNSEHIDLIERLLHSSDIDKHGFNKEMARKHIDLYRQTVNKAGYWFWFSQVQAFKLTNLLVLLVWWEQNMASNPLSNLKDIK